MLLDLERTWRGEVSLRRCVGKSPLRSYNRLRPRMFLVIAFPKTRGSSNGGVGLVQDQLAQGQRPFFLRARLGRSEWYFWDEREGRSFLSHIARPVLRRSWCPHVQWQKKKGVGGPLAPIECGSRPIDAADIRIPRRLGPLRCMPFQEIMERLEPSEGFRPIMVVSQFLILVHVSDLPCLSATFHEK